METSSRESSPRKSEGGGGASGVKFTPDDLQKWSNVLIKYRQFFAEIIMMILVYHNDEKMFDLLKQNLDIKIEFDQYDKLKPDEKFSKKDLLAIEALEKKLNFEKLGLFDEEMGTNYMRVFFGYVLSNPLDPPNTLNAKIKNIAKIFLNFFANVNDINLGALKLMNSDTIKIMKRDLDLSEVEANSPEKKSITAFVSYCETYYLNEREQLESEFETSFKQKLTEIHQTLMPHLQDPDKSQLQDMLFQNNFLWILINLVIKYSQYFKGEQEMTKQLINLFDFCLDQNLYHQNMMIQGKVLRFFELKKESLGRLGVQLIELAFKKNPTIMVSNQNYLNLFFNYSKKSIESQSVFITEADYYNSRAKFYELLSNYLDDKYYATAIQIPEYDLICLENILNTDYTEKEFLNPQTIIEI